MFVTLPLTLSWLMLGFARSFPIICVGFAMVGFCMGLKESSSILYVSEIRWFMIRTVVFTWFFDSNDQLWKYKICLKIGVLLKKKSILRWKKLCFYFIPYFKMPFFFGLSSQWADRSWNDVNCCSNVVQFRNIYRFGLWIAFFLASSCTNLRTIPLLLLHRCSICSNSVQFKRQV